MTGILCSPTLVLNTAYLPLAVCRAMEAVCLLVTGKADLLEGVEAEPIRSQKLSIPLPRVIRLLGYSGIPSNPAWSRLKVLYRDDMKCAWCGMRGRMEELDCDHVIPRSRWSVCPPKLRRPYETGARKLQNSNAPWNSWLNTLASCRRCNASKGNRFPWEIARKPLWAPYEPEYVPSLLISLEQATRRGWLDYLQTADGRPIRPAAIRVVSALARQ